MPLTVLLSIYYRRTRFTVITPNTHFREANRAKLTLEHAFSPRRQDIRVLALICILLRRMSYLIFVPVPTCCMDMSKHKARQFQVTVYVTRAISPASVLRHSRVTESCLEAQPR